QEYLKNTHRSVKGGVRERILHRDLLEPTPQLTTPAHPEEVRGGHCERSVAISGFNYEIAASLRSSR
ncbi:MAG: hypothetical protein ACYTGH_18060, partial [Planctomycetota bacterium]